LLAISLSSGLFCIVSSLVFSGAKAERRHTISISLMLQFERQCVACRPGNFSSFPLSFRTPDFEVADSSRSQNSATIQGYETYMKGHNLTPETVTLNHGATGLWIGDKDAKDVVVYYHGQFKHTQQVDLDKLTKSLQVVASPFRQ
jgi:hypothetical protein